MDEKNTKENIIVTVIVLGLAAFGIISFFNSHFGEIPEREYKRYVNYGDFYSEKISYKRYNNKLPNLGFIKAVKSIKIKEDIVQIDHLNRLSGSVMYKKRLIDTQLYTAFFNGRNNKRLTFEYNEDYRKYLPSSFYSNQKDKLYDVKIYYILTGNDRTLAYGFNKEHVEKEFEYLNKMIDSY